MSKATRLTFHDKPVSVTSDASHWERFFWEDGAAREKKPVRMRFYDRPSDVQPYQPTHVQRLQNINGRNRKFWERK